MPQNEIHIHEIMNVFIKESQHKGLSLDSGKTEMLDVAGLRGSFENVLLSLFQATASSTTRIKLTNEYFRWKTPVSNCKTKTNVVLHILFSRIIILRTRRRN